MGHDDPSEKPATSIHHAPRRRHILPLWVWIVLVVNGVLVAVLRGTDVLGDIAIANVATIVIALVTLIILIIWFAFFSGYRRRTRMLVLAGCVLGAAAFFALFRLDRLSGGMVPAFSFRYAKKPDQLLGQLPSELAAGGQAAVDLRTTSKHDFPQFLGPSRADSVEGIRLTRDWAAKPPRPLWRQAIGAGWSSFSVVNGHAVTMEQRGEQEMVTCYDVKTGRLEWVHSHPARFETTIAGMGPRSTPTIDQGMVYALGAAGCLMCLGRRQRPVPLGKRPARRNRGSATKRMPQGGAARACELAADCRRSADCSWRRSSRWAASFPDCVSQARRRRGLERRRPADQLQLAGIGHLGRRRAGADRQRRQCRRSRSENRQVPLGIPMAGQKQRAIRTFRKRCPCRRTGCFSPRVMDGGLSCCNSLRKPTGRSWPSRFGRTARS